MKPYYADAGCTLYRANALDLPLDDETVDLVITSPPYFGLRSYQDNGSHYAGQIGDEATPAEFVDALIAATREMVRVLKPSGSIWVNLGDKYAAISFAPQKRGKDASGVQRTIITTECERCGEPFTGGIGRRFCSSYCGGSDNSRRTDRGGIPTKSLIGVPWRYALRCIDDLGLILRAEVIWSKPNGLPESVTDRVRRSHETWFHFTKQPRYFSAVDEVREAHTAWMPNAGARPQRGTSPSDQHTGTHGIIGFNTLGKLPGSVWSIPTQPLRVPDHLGVDHFAAFPMEWPRRIIKGWSPGGVCVECGDGRRPVTVVTRHPVQKVYNGNREHEMGRLSGGMHSGVPATTSARIAGYACSCPAPTVERVITEFDHAAGEMVTRIIEVPDPTWTPPAPTRPAVVLDPFGGTGTTALVAKSLGRHGISVDLSADYCRLAKWRVTDPGELARALEVEKPPTVMDDQGDLLEGLLA